MTEKIQLGKDTGVSGNATAMVPDEERIRLLEKNVDVIFRMLDNVINIGVRSDGENDSKIPNGTTFLGRTKGEIFVLSVDDNNFNVGDRVFPSLSAAAEAVSGCRRSGWTFWKLVDGRTAKEAFKR